MGDEITSVELNGQEVKRLRREHGLTQDQLAAKVAKSRGHIWRIEREPGYRVSWDVAKNLAVALGVNVSSLLLNTAAAQSSARPASRLLPRRAPEDVAGQEQAGALVEPALVPQLPFGGGETSPFPNVKRLREERLIEELQALLQSARSQDSYAALLRELELFVAWQEFRLQGDRDER